MQILFKLLITYFSFPTLSPADLDHFRDATKMIARLVTRCDAPFLFVPLLRVSPCFFMLPFSFFNSIHTRLIFLFCVSD